MDLAEILKNWEANPGADPESIKKAEASLGLTFPDDYRQFLTRANGGVGNIGSSGGGDAYAFDLRSSPWSVGEEPIATSFSRFLERLTHDE
jgi:hypothetical protein